MMSPTDTFSGFDPPTSNTTYTPNQFFDVVLPHASRGAVRLVAYMIRRTLGWCDVYGNPQEPHAVISYRELEQKAGIGHSMIRAAIDECVAARYITCLRLGQPHTEQTCAVSALYELCWDIRGHYVTSPDEFQGFYSGNGNLTYIPNDFFDRLVPGESLGVIKVVGAIIRHTIGWQTQYGFRRQVATLSITALERITRSHRDTVRVAVKEALLKNYIVQTEPGYFDPNAGKTSCATVYGLKWRDAASLSRSSIGLEPSLTGSSIEAITPKIRTDKNTYIFDHSENPHGELALIEQPSLRKSARERSENPHGERSENPHGIKITTNNTFINNNNSSEVLSPPAVAAENLFFQPSVSPPSAISPDISSSDETTECLKILQANGFDAKTALKLATQHSLTSLQNQIAWLPLRKPSRNPLGMLRRALEEDWPSPVSPDHNLSSSPEAVPEMPKDSGACRFAAAFYAGWAGNDGEALAPPSPNDLTAAAPFVSALSALRPDALNPEDWGRAFGALVKKAEQDNPRVVCSLVYALRVHGDAFLIQFRQQGKSFVQKVQTVSRNAHKAQYQDQYQAYLRAQKEILSQQYPAQYDAFIASEALERQKLHTGYLARSPIGERVQTAFDTEERHLERFAEFFQADEIQVILSFWQWDSEVNPEGLSNKSK